MGDVGERRDETYSFDMIQDCLPSYVVKEERGEFWMGRRRERTYINDKHMSHSLGLHSQSHSSFYLKIKDIRLNSQLKSVYRYG